MVRAVVGAVAMIVAFAGTVLSAAGETREAPAPIAKKAYYTYPATQVLPPLLFTGFPPSTACLVAGLAGAAQLCGPEVIGIGEDLGLSDGIPVVVTPDGEVAQPLTPGTYPVGMLGGQQRWNSLFALQLPELPEGEQIGSLEITFFQDDLGFALESPAFRDAVLTVLSQVSNQDPAAVADLLMRVLGEQSPVFTQTITGIEACPLKDGWNGGSAQNAGQGGTRVPRADCLLGTTGVFDPSAGSFTFDLTFMAQAWTTGDADGNVLPNNGFILRPVGAPNLAYGDPDLSTNWLVTLATDEAVEGLRPRIRYTTVPAPEDFDDISDELGDVGPVVDFFPDTSGGEFALPPTEPLAPVGPSNVVTIPGGGDIVARWGDRNESDVGITGLSWLLIPIGLFGAFLFGESLLSQPAHGRRRPGALTELMRNRDPSDTPDPREGIS